MSSASTSYAPPLSMNVRIHLSVMMFLQFAIWGSWGVVFFEYVQSTLKFTGSDAGWIFGNMALGAIVSPMIVGFLADRFISSEKLMAILHFIGAGLLYWQAEMQNPSFGAFFTASLLFALVYNPTLALANSIAFTHVPNATRDFPGIRLFGTLGWILVNLLVGETMSPRSNQPLLLGAGLSVLLGLYSFALPHTPPTGKSGDPLPFLKAFSLFKDFSFAVFFVISGLITIALAFYYSNTSSYLGQLDASMVDFGEKYFVKDSKINPNNTMLIGQIVEVLMLLVLPAFLRTFGMKGVLILGMLSWGLRYYLFSQMGPWPAVLAGVALHGFCFDFFFAAAFIHVDNTAPKEIRASGQALFSLLTYGVGMWLGSILSGWMNDTYKMEGTPDRVNWAQFWLVPCYVVLGCAVVFVLLFRTPSKERSTT
jgi:nucleoside transporter